jgi:transaldolase
VENAEFARLVLDLAVGGATSNPAIFAKAITGSDRYDEQLRELADADASDRRELFFAWGLDDIRAAARTVVEPHRQSHGRDGFVSFECTPDLADDTLATIDQALDLWSRLSLPNVMIKVPATAAGVPAIEELTACGVNVNVTLLFSVQRYEEVIEAYLRGLERRVPSGEPLGGISPVASFFVSRVHTKAEAQLPRGVPAAGPDRDRQRPSSLRSLPRPIQR